MNDGKANILIVDDRPEKVLSLEAVLEDLGQNIVRAYSGREALRQVLARDFAVILLDVNMPGMDGFETASLIRQRARSAGTPIIFITAFGDEIHAARGYSLGAVDYIQAPVIPDVLRTKVAVFVDLYRKTEQVRRQADALRHRATQLQKLAAASVAINAALSLEKMLQTITDCAREVIGAHQAITVLFGNPSAGLRAQRTLSVGSFSDKYASWRGRGLELDPVARTAVAQSRTSVRMTEQELIDHPDWEIVRQLDIPPICGGMVAAPLTGRGGAKLGVIYACDRDGPFTPDDEAVLVQLAQMGSIAVDNAIYAQEREANRLKDEFLATLSHELRTPLNAILGWTQLLRCEPLEEEVAHGLDVIDRSARSQAKLIDDLLDVSRITAGKLRLDVRPMSLGTVVRSAVDSVRPAAEARGVRLAAGFSYDGEDAGAGDDAMMGDPDRLQQVVWNLLSNAVKFTPAGGLVEVTAGIDHRTRRVHIAVRDTGLGIDRQFLPYVFDRFRQADSTSTRSHGGLGIGLTIVRHIVELHGGTVSAHSGGIGQGTSFAVELPLRPASSHQGQPEDDQAATTSSPGAPAAAPLDGELAHVRVLLVEDESDARDVTATLLRRCGAEVSTAGSCAQAIDLLRACRPDVLISDIAMPEADGYDLIARIRALDAGGGRDVPAIALTAYARDEDRERALAEGYQDHLPKPADPVELVRAIRRLSLPKITATMEA